MKALQEFKTFGLKERGWVAAYRVYVFKKRHGMRLNFFPFTARWQKA